MLAQTRRVVASCLACLIGESSTVLFTKPARKSSDPCPRTPSVDYSAARSSVSTTRPPPGLARANLLRMDVAASEVLAP